MRPGLSAPPGRPHWASRGRSADARAFVLALLEGGEHLKPPGCPAGAQGNGSHRGLGQIELQFCPLVVPFSAPLSGKKHTGLRSSPPLSTALQKGVLDIESDPEDGDGRPERHDERTRLFSAAGRGHPQLLSSVHLQIGGSPDPLPGSVSLLEWLKNSGRHFLTVTGSRKDVRAEPDAYPDGERHGQGSGGSVPEGSGVQHPPSHHREALRIPHC